MTTHEGLLKIIKLLHNNFLLEDDAEQLIDEYVPKDPEEEEEKEEGEIQRSPDQTPAPHDDKIQEEDEDDDVVITGEVQTGKGKQAVEGSAPTKADYWKDVVADLDDVFAEMERKQNKAQLDVDFQAVTEQLAKDTAGGSNLGIDDFLVYTMAVGPPMAPSEQEAVGEAEQSEQEIQAEQAEQIGEPEPEMQEQIPRAAQNKCRNMKQLNPHRIRREGR